MDTPTLVWIVTIAGFTFEVLGVIAAVDAVFTGRTSQGTIAWVIALVMLPMISVPMYFVFGSRRFVGYVKARRRGTLGIDRIARDLAARLTCFAHHVREHHAEYGALEKLSRMPFTSGNHAELLIDGEATFAAVFDAIDHAEKYLLVQFFIIHDDGLGKRFKARLLAAAKRGVRVHLLYDAIGSHGLPRAYVDELEREGVKSFAFRTVRGRSHRYQLNFRNHRKIVIADGRVALVGGLNVGDEYMGLSKLFGPWRDTFVKVQGPSVQCVQLAYLEDWYWATQTVPDLEWEPRAVEGDDNRVLVMPSGPADDLETCGLMFVHLINSAKKRLWIASPYFVPDEQIEAALQLAGLRGVDVRIMIPQKPDHPLVWLSSFTYYEWIKLVGVKIFRYQPGFMHHKIVLSDDVATVGTANLDNRSVRINFEITLVFADETFSSQVATMLEQDMTRCRSVAHDEFARKPWWFRVAARVARLTSPIQ